MTSRYSLWRNKRKYPLQPEVPAYQEFMAPEPRNFEIDSQSTETIHSYQNVEEADQRYEDPEREFSEEETVRVNANARK